MQHVLETSKRVFTAAIAAATIAFSVGVAGVISPLTAKAASGGDLIKGTSLSTVYYMGYDGLRYAFPNEKTFFSWYGDFNGVMTISDSELAGITLGGNVVVRPGTHFIKVTSDPKVYAVGRDGSIHWIESEDVALDLAGSDWASNVIDVPDVFFDDYTVGTSLMTATAFEGAVFEMGGITYVSWDGEMRELTSAGMSANNIWDKFVLDGGNVDDSALTMGDDITGSLTVLVDPAQNYNGSEVSGDVSASLSPSTPAAGTIVQGQATAELAKFNFTGNGTVTSVTLNRSGLSDQNTLTNVYLFDGNTRITDGYSFNSTGSLTMNGLDIDVNGTTAISVKADVGSSANAPTGQTVAVTLSSFAVDGYIMSANAMGNTMTVGSGASLASAYLSANTVSAATVNAGTPDFTVWSAPLQVNTREVSLKSVNFRLTGSAPADALSNIQLYVDGIAKGSEATVDMINGSNYAMFDFSSSPIALSTGSHTIAVRATIEKGSSFNVTAALSLAADMMLTDSQLGINLAVLGAAGAAFSANTAGAITISAGSVTMNVDPTFQTMNTISGGTTNATIGKFKLHGYGEDVKVNTLVVTPVFSGQATTYSSGAVTAGSNTITVADTTGFVVGNIITVAGATTAIGTITAIPSSTTMTVNFTTAGATPAGAVTVSNVASGYNGLDNVAIYFEGVQVGSSQDWSGTGNLTFTPGSQMIVPAGEDSYLEVRSDIRSNAAVTFSGGTISANIVVGSSNAEGQTSKTTISTPAVTGNSLTIQTGLLAVSQNSGYASQSVSPNTSGVKIGSFTLQNQSSSESVRVTNLSVLLTYGAGAGSTNLSALKTSETSGSAGTPVQPTTAAASASATNNFSADFTLAPGASKTIDILANSGSSSGSTVTVIPTLTVTSIGVTSNVSTVSSAVTGQTITFNTGTVTNPPTLLTASSTPAQYIAAGVNGATDATKATYNFVSTNGASTITELKFVVTGTNTVTNVCVGTKCAAPVSGVAYITGLNLAVPNGGSGLTQDVMVSYATVGTTGTTPATTSRLSLSYIKYTSGGTSTTTVQLVATPDGAAYTDTDSSSTVTAGDVRRAAQVSVVSSYAVTAGDGAVTFDATATNSADENRTYGTVTTGQTIILTETADDSGIIGTITGTLVSTGGFTCTARNAADGAGSATTTISAIQSILCTNATTSSQVVLNVDPIGTDGVAAANITTITLATDTTTLASGTTVAANDSDLNATLAAGGIVAPTMTLVGSKPTVSVSSTQGTGLILASNESKLGEVTVTADAKGNIKVNDIVFTVGSSGFSTAPTAVTSPRIANGTTTISGSSCSPSSLVVTCEFGTTSNSDFDGITITAGTSQTFTLYGILNGANTGTGTPTITTSVGASTFNWDDTSTNGGAGSTGLTGTLIYNFPTSSYTIKQ